MSPRESGMTGVVIASEIRGLFDIVRQGLNTPPAENEFRM